MLSIYLNKLKRRVNARPTRSGAVRQDKWRWAYFAALV